MYVLPYSLGRSLTEPEAHWLGWQARELLGPARLQPAVLSTSVQVQDWLFYVGTGNSK